MRDETAAPRPGLKPANENPWYVLMTLYGEQGNGPNEKEIQKKNRDAWNAWSASNDPSKALAKVEEYWNFDELGRPRPIPWSKELRQLFFSECAKRGYPQDRVPYPDSEIGLYNLNFPIGLDLTGYLFCQPIVMGRCRFSRFSARDAVFTKQLTLEDNEFTGNVVFFRTCFLGQYYAAGNEYLEGANFRYAAFNSTMTSLYDTYRREAAFSGNLFKGAADFQSTKFLQASSEIDHDCLFQNCEFHAPTNFRSTVFGEFYPDFHGVVLHERTLFTAEEENWPPTTKQPIEQARNSCAAIRHILALQSLPEEEHFFFRREMYFAGRIGSLWQRLPYLLFGIFSDYGHSIARPALWLLGLWAFGLAAFWGYFADCCVPSYGGEVRRPFGAAFGLSFSNLFPLFGFGRLYFGEGFMESLPASLKFLSGLQTVFSLPLLFFLGLGLRQRFRLR